AGRCFKPLSHLSRTSLLDQISLHRSYSTKTRRPLATIIKLTRADDHGVVCACNTLLSELIPRSHCSTITRLNRSLWLSCLPRRCSLRSFRTGSGLSRLYMRELSSRSSSDIWPFAEERNHPSTTFMAKPRFFRLRMRGGKYRW